jgi:tetratricopeptide (TPR) repeat protein
MKKGGRHSFNNAFNEVLAYSPSMQNPYLGWRMALAAFAGGRKNDAREWLESFVKTDNPEMQHLYELIIQRMPESFFKRRFFLNELWRQCQANPENFELLRAYVYACISWLNPEVILTRHGIYSRVFKALRLAFDESCPNWNAASYIIENLDILSGSWLVNLYVFFKREKIMSNCSLRFAMARYYLSVKRPKKILKCLENDSRNLMRSFDEAFTIIYAYQALGRYEEAKEIFETARLSLPYDRFRLPDTSACMLFIYAVEENWKKCKQCR